MACLVIVAAIDACRATPAREPGASRGPDIAPLDPARFGSAGPAARPDAEPTDAPASSPPSKPQPAPEPTAPYVPVPASERVDPPARGDDTPPVLPDRVPSVAERAAVKAAIVASKRRESKGRLGDAWPGLEAVLSLAPRDPALRYAAASLLGRIGRKADALLQLSLLAIIPGEEAASALRRTRVDPDFAPLHDDPRFRQITRYELAQIVLGPGVPASLLPRLREALAAAELPSVGKGSSTERVEGARVRHPKSSSARVGALRAVLGEPIVIEEIPEGQPLTVLWSRAAVPMGPLTPHAGVLLACDGTSQNVRMRFEADGRFARWAMARDGSRRERWSGRFSPATVTRWVLRYAEEVDTFPADRAPSHRRREAQRVEWTIAVRPGGPPGGAIAVGPLRCQRAPDDSLPWGAETPPRGPVPHSPR